MRKPWFAIVFLALSILAMLAVASSSVAKASPTPSSLDVKVDHVVEIRNGGLLIINDTVRLSPIGENVTLHSYVFGFPYAYQSNLDYAFAYETSNLTNRLKLELNAGMGRIGFYGMNVVFPQAVTINNGERYEFTVVFVISKNILASEAGGTFSYTAFFPAYPSLNQSVSEANLTIIFPVGLNYTDSSYKREGVNFTNTTVGTKQYLSYVKNNLTEFSDQAGWVTIVQSTRTLELLEVKEAKRNIELGFEQIAVTDSYRMVSEGDKLFQININLPKEAFDVSAYDEFGLISSDKLKVGEESTHTNLTITFPIAYDPDEEAQFAVHYQLPWKDYVSTEGWSDFHVSMTFFENRDWSIRKLTTTVVLPEGATLLSPVSSFGLNSVQNDAFRSSLTFVFQNITSFQDLSFSFKYERALFWESFRPTVWTGAFIVIILAISGAWRVYRPPAAPLPTAIIRIQVEELRNFVDSYDEKRRLMREIESLEAQVRKGKIPRRQYKVRKMSLESRLTSFSRDLSKLKEKIRMAGPRYADLMRQLEVAENELEGVDANISRTEVRYRRGEISAAAYHKLLEDSYRRRDRAKTTIDGVLLRLREETS